MQAFQVPDKPILANLLTTEAKTVSFGNGGHNVPNPSESFYTLPLTLVRGGGLLIAIVETTLSNWAAIAFRNGARVGPVGYYGRIRTALHYADALAGGEAHTSETTADSLAISPKMHAQIVRARHMRSDCNLIPPPCLPLRRIA